MLKKVIKKLLNSYGYDIVKKNQETLITEINENEKNILNKVKKYTLTNTERLWLLIQSFKYVYRNKIDGDLVECGIWKGGNLVLMGELCLLYGTNKKIYGYDTFEGMTEPNNYDVTYANKSAKKNLSKYKKDKNNKDSMWAISGYEETNNNILESTIYKNFQLIKGDVVSTLSDKKNLPKKISILRLDTDFYESTKKELETLYPLLSVGGILIIDDYGHWKGCQKAVDEYFKEKKIELFMCDFSCRYFIKSE